MSLESTVATELEEMKGDKPKLMQKYSDLQQAILKKYGGNISDIPMDKNHEYHKLQEKIQTLHRMA